MHCLIVIVFRTLLSCSWLNCYGSRAVFDVIVLFIIVRSVAVLDVICFEVEFLYILICPFIIALGHCSPRRWERANRLVSIDLDLTLATLLGERDSSLKVF